MPAHEWDTLHTVFIKCKAVAQRLGRKYSVILLDEALYSKGQQLVWSNLNEYKDVILRLGGFHVALDYLKVIGTRFRCSGIKEFGQKPSCLDPPQLRTH